MFLDPCGKIANAALLIFTAGLIPKVCELFHGKTSVNMSEKLVSYPQDKWLMIANVMFIVQIGLQLKFSPSYFSKLFEYNCILFSSNIFF